jgi:hypothetical protein
MKYGITEETTETEGGSEIGCPRISFILMFEHFMPNIIIEKGENVVSNSNSNRKIKLAKVLSYLFKNELLFRLPMKYCTIGKEVEMLPTDFNCNCKLFSPGKSYGKYESSYSLINTLLIGLHAFYGSLKKFIKIVA